MGVLDEAIREHLALKRRRGASTDELTRQEAEALGPVRREPPSGDTGDQGRGSAPLGDAPLFERAGADPTRPVTGARASARAREEASLGEPAEPAARAPDRVAGLAGTGTERPSAATPPAAGVDAPGTVRGEPASADAPDAPREETSQTDPAGTEDRLGGSRDTEDVAPVARLEGPGPEVARAPVAGPLGADPDEPPAAAESRPPTVDAADVLSADRARGDRSGAPEADDLAPGPAGDPMGGSAIGEPPSDASITPVPGSDPPDTPPTSAEAEAAPPASVFDVEALDEDPPAVAPVRAIDPDVGDREEVLEAELVDEEVVDEEELVDELPPLGDPAVEEALYDDPDGGLSTAEPRPEAGTVFDRPFAPEAEPYGDDTELHPLPAEPRHDEEVTGFHSPVAREPEPYEEPTAFHPPPTAEPASTDASTHETTELAFEEDDEFVSEEDEGLALEDDPEPPSDGDARRGGAEAAGPALVEEAELEDEEDALEDEELAADEDALLDPEADPLLEDEELEDELLEDELLEDEEAELLEDEVVPAPASPTPSDDLGPAPPDSPGVDAADTATSPTGDAPETDSPEQAPGGGRLPFEPRPPRDFDLDR